MATRRKRDVQAQPTAANQTRGLTPVQRRVNRTTGVDTNYNYNRGQARAASYVFNQLPRGYSRMTAANQSRVRRNINRRKRNGGSGG